MRTLCTLSQFEWNRNSEFRQNQLTTIQGNRRRLETISSKSSSNIICEQYTESTISPLKYTDLSTHPFQNSTILPLQFYIDTIQMMINRIICTNTKQNALLLFCFKKQREILLYINQYHSGFQIDPRIRPFKLYLTLVKIRIIYLECRQ